MSQQLIGSSSDNKARNILTLEERVRVIQMYELKPVYQMIANTFKCSSKQIKNIIANRESILQYYHANCMSDGYSNKAKRQRQKQIIFLGKVMYEYIQRVQRHSHRDTHLTTQSIRAKALEVKEAIKIPNFYPNNAWMNNFKSEYGITDFDLSVRRTDNSHRGPSSFDISDIISYVSNREQQCIEEQENSGSGNPFDIAVTQYDEVEGGDGDGDEEGDITDARESGPSLTYGQIDCFANGIPYNYYSNDIVSLESDDDNDDSIANGPHAPKIQNVASITSTAAFQIASYADALQHLKPLEEFALLEENYRAIGLISQLESIFRNAVKGGLR